MPDHHVLWARRVLKQPAGGSREGEAALAGDLHVHLDHVPADTGETAPQAAHVRVVDDTDADRSPGSDGAGSTDRGNGSGSGSGSGTESTSDPTSRQPDRTVRRDR